MSVSGSAERETGNQSGVPLFKFPELALVKLSAIGLKNSGATDAETTGSCPEKDKADKNHNQNNNHGDGVFTKGLKHRNGVSLFSRWSGGGVVKQGVAKDQGGSQAKMGCLMAAVAKGGMRLRCLDTSRGGLSPPSTESINLCTRFGNARLTTAVHPYTKTTALTAAFVVMVGVNT